MLTTKGPDQIEQDANVTGRPMSNKTLAQGHAKRKKIVEPKVCFRICRLH